MGGATMRPPGGPCRDGRKEPGGAPMGLTSPLFVVLLALPAVAAFVTCVRALPRVRGGGPRPVLLRSSMVLGTQAMVVLAVLAAANSSFVFFGSWSDLLGTDHGPVRIAGGPAGREPAAASRLRPGRDPLAARLPARDGRLQSVVLHGARSGLSARAYVYLPPQYARPSYRRRRLPVVLVLTADVRALLTRLRLPAVAAARVAAGAAPPVVYVMMRPPAPCVDVPGGPQGDTFLTQDVPMAISGSYRVARDGPGWGVLGDATAGSLGGYCAARLPLAHSDRFVAGASAAAGFGAPAGNLYGGSAAIRAENDLGWRLAHRPPPPADLLVLTWRGNAAGARRLLARIRPPTRAGRLALTAGGALPGWKRDLPAVLSWFGARLTSKAGG